MCVLKAVPSLLRSPFFRKASRIEAGISLRASTIDRISLDQMLYHSLIDPRVPPLVRPEEFLRGRVDLTRFPLDPWRMH